MEEAAFDDVHLSSNVGMRLLGGLKSCFEGPSLVDDARGYNDQHASLTLEF
jgi:hypothetical protein